MLKLYLHVAFQVRLANNTYSLEKHSLFEYETHFTVMVSSKLNYLLDSIRGANDNSSRLKLARAQQACFIELELELFSKINRVL